MFKRLDTILNLITAILICISIGIYMIAPPETFVYIIIGFMAGFVASLTYCVNARNKLGLNKHDIFLCIIEIALVSACLLFEFVPIAYTPRIILLSITAVYSLICMTYFSLIKTIVFKDNK